MMDTKPPDIPTSGPSASADCRTGSASLDEPEGAAGDPTGIATTLPVIGFLGLVVIVVIALGLIGGLPGLIIAIVVLVLGVFGLTRSLQRVSRTRASARRLRQGLAGMNEDLAVTDEAHEEVSPNDLPLDSPAHREVVRRIHEHEANSSEGDERSRRH